MTSGRGRLPSDTGPRELRPDVMCPDTWAAPSRQNDGSGSRARERVDHVLSSLTKGVTREELVVHLKTELDAHFGLPEATGLPDAVDRLLAWWDSHR
jgi:hypothetical protein